MEAPVVVGLLSRRSTRPPALDAVFDGRTDVLRWAGVFAEILDVPEHLDLVLVDLDEMPRRWEGAVTGLVAAAPRRRVVFLGRSFSPALRRKANELGVTAFVVTTSAPDALARALRAAASVRRGRSVTEALGGAGQRWAGRELGLTMRESEVLCLSALGLTNSEIADRLYINVQTVKSHMKRVYKRIGVRNRAEAASFAYSSGLIATTTVADDVAGNEIVSLAALASDEPVRTLRERFELDEQAIAARSARFGLRDEAVHRLREIAEDARDVSARSVEGLLATWRAYADTAPLAADQTTRDRVVEHLGRYTAELLSGELGEEHVEIMLRAGATLRLFGIAPSWILLSLGRLVCDHVDVLFAKSASASEAVDRVVALVAAVFFDLSVLVEPYLVPDTASGRVSMITDVAVAEADVEARRRFLDLPSGRPEPFPRRADATHPVRAAADHVRERLDVARLDPGDGAALVAEGVSLLDEFASCEVDRGRAASCRRVGLHCRRVGLSAESVLLCASTVVRSALRGVPGADVSPSRVSAFLRTMWFDASFTLDEVLGASGERAVIAGAFADRLGPTLTTGIALLGPNGTVVVADTLLGRPEASDELSPSRHLVRAALRSPLVAELGAQALADPHGAFARTTVLRDRTLRVGASAVAGVAPLAGPYVAVVIQDVTESRAAHEVLIDENRRLSAALRAVGAAVWEIDPGDLTLLALSRHAEEIVGARDLDLVGRRTWIELLQEDDRRWFLRAVRRIGLGERAERDHRMGPPGGTPIWLRTAMIGTEDHTGRRTVSGVSRRIVGRDEG